MRKAQRAITNISPRTLNSKISSTVIQMSMTSAANKKKKRHFDIIAEELCLTLRVLDQAVTLKADPRHLLEITVLILCLDILHCSILLSSYSA